MVYLKDDLDATELVQEVFLKIWEKRDKLAGVDSFINYLFILARNHIFDGFRKKAAEQSALSHFFRNAPIGAVDDADHLIRNKQYEKLVKDAVDQLSPARKKVYLARQQGKSFQTIAKELDISETTAKKQATQAKQFIQEYILQYLHLYGILLLTGQSLSVLPTLHA